ncbi:MAG TPA: hypothetical protein VLL77_09950, partial [Anaerolineales bacterium]|nr:hypothetical protein [Anaerolineales bacterium]
DSRREAARYPAEVRHRVALERLLERLLDDESAGTTRAGARLGDDVVRSLLHNGPFVWDLFLEEVYPPEPYWFLYGIPRASDG